MRTVRTKALTPVLSHLIGEGASSSAVARTTRLRLRVTAAAEKQIRAGHPWVFSQSVREQNRAGIPGELAVIFDRQDKFLAAGFFDPDSPICVRVLQMGKPQAIDREFWRERLDAALRRREGLFDEETNGHRLINGESDGWPGLVLDRYAETLVLKIYTAAWGQRLEELVSLLHERLKPGRIVFRASRNLRGLAASKNLPPHPGPLPLGGGEGESSPASIADGAVLLGPALNEAVGFREGGLRFEAEVLRGQKTGFFLDQRENRARVEALAHGRTVLNAFSFSGGFSLYAARGGASAVTDLDISQHALESARRNFALNRNEPSIARCRFEHIRSDAFVWLAGNAQRQFDLIVLDPPSLAKRETERAGAIRAYGKLAADGLSHLRAGGILVACSCSAHVSAEEFIGAVRTAAWKSGRKFEELCATRHAADHPATFREAEYLKAIYLRFG